MSARTPQELLDMLQAINIPSIYASVVSDKDAAKLVRQHLKTVKSELRDAQKLIGSQYDGRDSYQKRREDEELEPYHSIETLIEKLETRNVELDTVGMREPLQFGNVFYGASGYWRIGSQIDAKIWTVKREYAIASSKLDRDKRVAEENINKEKNNYEQAVAAARKRVENLIKDYQTATANLKKEQEQFKGLGKWVILAVVILISGGAIAFLDRGLGSQGTLAGDWRTLNHAFVGIIAILILGYIVVTSWLNPLLSIRSIKTRLPILRKSAEEAKNNYKPTVSKLQLNLENALTKLQEELEEVQQRIERTRSEFEHQIQQLEAQLASL